MSMLIQPVLSPTTATASTSCWATLACCCCFWRPCEAYRGWLVDGSLWLLLALDGTPSDTTLTGIVTRIQGFNWLIVILSVCFLGCGWLLLTPCHRIGWSTYCRYSSSSSGFTTIALVAFSPFVVNLSSATSCLEISLEIAMLVFVSRISSFLGNCELNGAKAKEWLEKKKNYENEVNGGIKKLMHII